MASVEKSVKERYAAAASAPEVALCCPLITIANT